MQRRALKLAGTVLAVILPTCAALAAGPPLPLPPPSSPAFCVAVQELMATTSLKAHNTVFRDAPAYRHSKPSVKPFEIYQLVTYAGQQPIMVSCKLKTAAHLRAVHGDKAAGRQLQCPDITREIQAMAVLTLRGNQQPTAADKAAAFVIDDNEPYITGMSYLADFPLSYQASDGRIHLNSPGLFQDYDSWITPLLPARLQGQSYCHLPTVEYMTALATGEMQPGTEMTPMDDEAQVH